MKTLRNFFLMLCMITVAGFTTTSCDGNKTAGEQIEEAGEDMADAFRTEREELQADLREIRNDIDTKLTELRQDMETASDESKAAIQQQIDKLEKWGENLDRDMERVAQSAENSWEDLKSNVRKTLQEIETAWNNTFDS